MQHIFTAPFSQFVTTPLRSSQASRKNSRLAVNTLEKTSQAVAPIGNGINAPRPIDFSSAQVDARRQED